MECETCKTTMEKGELTDTLYCPKCLKCPVCGTGLQKGKTTSVLFCPTCLKQAPKPTI